MSSASAGRVAVQSTAAEETLQQKLADFSSLLARLKRFALLNEEVQIPACLASTAPLRGRPPPRLGRPSRFGWPAAIGAAVGGDVERRPRSPSRTSTVLRDRWRRRSRNLLADLLCALRVCDCCGGGVKACAEQQTSDAFLNLNLPAVRRAFPAGQQPPASPSPAAAAEQQEGSPAAATAVGRGGGGGGGDGFASFSSNRHSTSLCYLVQQVAAFIPLPFNHDPLLLKWFDEHSELWQSLHSMNAPKASRSVQHGITDRKRMEAAQTLLQQALEAHNATVPRVLPPDASNDWSAFPPHVLGAPDASSVPIPSPAPAPSPPDKWRESKWGASPAEGGGFGGGAPLSAGKLGGSRGSPHGRGLTPGSSDGRRLPSLADSRPRTSASGLETSSSGGGRRPGSASSLRRATSRANP